MVVRVKGQRSCIAVSGTPSHSYGVSLAIWDHTVLPDTNEHMSTLPIPRSLSVPWMAEHVVKQSSEIPRSCRAPWTAEHLCRHSSEIQRRQNDHNFEVRRSEENFGDFERLDFSRSRRHSFSRSRLKKLCSSSSSCLVFL